MIKKYKIILSILILFFLSNCGEYEILTIEKEARRVSDSLFNTHKDSLRKVSDTICQERYEQLYQIFLDSLIVEQGERIKELIKK